MSARVVLAIHASVFFSFAAASLASPLLIYSYPDVFAGRYVVAGAGILMLLVIGSWPLFGGCPFTMWENKLRMEESGTPYSGPCIDHYAIRWFSIRLPAQLSTAGLIVLLALPMIAGVVNW